MPIEGVFQPATINITPDLRLKAFDGVFEFALNWYQDRTSLELIDGKGKTEPYTLERIERMYIYLNSKGELYFIEKKIAGCFVPIGDVTFWHEDMPIVISQEYRGQGIGKMVVMSLIERAKELGFTELHISEIYDFNTGSRCLFEACGFLRGESTEEGARYSLMLR